MLSAVIALKEIHQALPHSTLDILDNYTHARRGGLPVFLNGYVITMSDAKLLVFHADYYVFRPSIVSGCETHPLLLKALLKAAQQT